MYGPHYKIPIAYETAPSVTTNSVTSPQAVVSPGTTDKETARVMDEAVAKYSRALKRLADR